MLRNPPPFLDFLQGAAASTWRCTPCILIAIVLFLPKGVFGSIRDQVAPMSLLEVEGLSKAFAGLHAVENVVGRGGRARVPRHHRTQRGRQDDALLAAGR